VSISEDYIYKLKIIVNVKIIYIYIYIKLYDLYAKIIAQA